MSERKWMMNCHDWVSAYDSDEPVCRICGLEQSYSTSDCKPNKPFLSSWESAFEAAASKGDGGKG